MLDRFRRKGKSQAVTEASYEETTGTRDARQERQHAEQLLVQTRARSAKITRVTSRAKDITEANDFVRTIDFCMERR